MIRSVVGMIFNLFYLHHRGNISVSSQHRHHIFGLRDEGKFDGGFVLPIFEFELSFVKTVFVDQIRSLNSVIIRRIMHWSPLSGFKAKDIGTILNEHLDVHNLVVDDGSMKGLFHLIVLIGPIYFRSLGQKTEEIDGIVGGVDDHVIQFKRQILRTFV